MFLGSSSSVPDMDDIPEAVHSAPWAVEGCTHRMTVKVDPIGLTRHDHPIMVDLPEADVISDATDPLVSAAEVTPDGTHLGEIPAQIDQSRDGSGWTLTLLAVGESEPHSPRLFHVYTGNEVTTASPTDAVVAVDDVGEYCGQETWKIETPAATYMFHQIGGGFASLLDEAGNDWISHRPGEYRGIPNLVHPESGFHPGHDGAHSEVIADGPIRAHIEVETDDGEWAGRWEIFPHHATLTVTKAGHPYWYLYEGTPGGELTPEDDFMVRSDGERISAAEEGAEDLPNPEWIYLGSEHADAVLYHVHHEDDPAIDSYWPRTAK